MIKCKANNLRPKTLDSYLYHLKAFLVDMDTKGLHFIHEVTLDTLTDYIANIDRHLSTVTIRGRYIVLKLFFSYLYTTGIIENNLFTTLKAPKVSKRIIYAFSAVEIQEILNCFDKSSYIGFRNYTIMAVLFSTGIRKSELLQLRLSDILANNDAVKVIGKGDKERIIPISPALQRILQAYLKKRKEYQQSLNVSIPCWSLWVSRRGSALTTSGLNMIFKQLKLSKKSWSTRVSAHTWRHTFAKLYLLNGGDIFTLQKVLGHGDSTTTSLYLDMNITELKQQNDKFNPLDNTRWQYY